MFKADEDIIMELITSKKYFPTPIYKRNHSFLTSTVDIVYICHCSIDNKTANIIPIHYDEIIENYICYYENIKT